jgi:hypothetical protein
MSEAAATQEMSAEQAELLARRVRRMMVIAGLTTALGMAAILVTIGYRLYRGEGSTVASDLVARLPKGAKITSSTVSGDRVVVTVDTPAGLEIRTFDARTLKPTGRLKFAAEP